MTLPISLPLSGDTSWYDWASAVHDAVDVNRAPYILVASTDAPTAIKNVADYVCDGTADQVQINDAIEEASALSARGGHATGVQAGTVQLTGGEFSVSGSVLMRTGVTLQGAGLLTWIKPISLSTSTGSGAQPAIIKLYDANVHATHVRDLWLYGNFGSGGSGCHGIYYEGSGGGDQSDWPDTDPDSNNIISHLYISKFTTGTRHGIRISNTDMRGTRITQCDIRNIDTGYAIFIDGAPDGHIDGVHIGGAIDGVRIDGGNWKVLNTKVYYADSYGFNFLNTRMTAAGLEAQDCYNGVNVGASDVIIEGLLIDTCDITGLTIAGSRVKVGFTMLHRSSGRYVNTNTGVSFSGTQTGLNVQGTINTSDITTPVSGTTSGSANFVRISHGTTLVTEG